MLLPGPLHYFVFLWEIVMMLMIYVGLLYIFGRLILDREDIDADDLDVILTGYVNISTGAVLALFSLLFVSVIRSQEKTPTEQ